MSNRRDKWDKLRRQSKVWTHGNQPMESIGKGKSLRSLQRMLDRMEQDAKRKAKKARKAFLKRQHELNKAWRREWYGRNLT